ncbi:serine hydrolase domain-containing protein [Maricaulis sp.]|uniref:serine hydrolase domain-containing protein n=1 Tax=Maricaulis sp. TaxID=1486257 RepID=UPI0026208D8D|nr:serine hydrolase domain-containing protein [Maricaulis sp.]
MLSVILAATLLSQASPLENWVTENGFTGHVIIAEGETILSEAVAGPAAPGRAMTSSETWRWASVSKQIVAVAVMQDVEAGRLQLDASLDSLVPDFPARHADRITLRDLMRHTSGLPQPDYAIAPTLDDLSPMSLSSACDGAGERPGERFSYNNCDTILLGVVLERLHGESWVETLRRRIFEPAGMNETIALTPSGEAETVSGYAGAGRPDPSDAPAPGYYGPSGALAGPARDLVAFNAALMEGRLLGDSARSALWRGEARLGYVALGAWSYATPLAGCEGAVELIERRGGIGYHQARTLMAPATGRSLIILTNRGDYDFGELWMGSGWGYELASLAFCSDS